MCVNLPLRLTYLFTNIQINITHKILKKVVTAVIETATLRRDVDDSGNRITLSRKFTHCCRY